VSKADIRNSPRWLDALDLPGDEIQVRVYPPARTKIYLRRRELTKRVYPVAASAAPSPLPRHRSALRDAVRNAALLLAAVSGLAACVHWL